jgi:riboflavin kinase / FMN adenylyltransferase
MASRGAVQSAFGGAVNSLEFNAFRGYSKIRMLVARGQASRLHITHGSKPELAGPLAVTIGNFDGVHRGHQAMLQRVLASARARRLTAGVLTFEPHPRELFTPASAPTRLTSLREKLELLAAHGVQHVHVQRFSHAFAALSPESFISDVLIGALQARWVLIGSDFRFGAKRAGDFAVLAEAAPRYGFELEPMPLVADDGVRVSSSAVRDALARGDLARARNLLGRHYSISGRVVHGEKLGRYLGFATANVQLKHNRPPLTGIFAVRVHGVGQDARNGVASLGVRPTVSDSGKATLEVHLFDFVGDLYGEHLRVEFLAKIRDEAKYPDLDALKAQIARDCDAARGLLKALDHV